MRAVPNIIINLDEKRDDKQRRIVVRG